MRPGKQPNHWLRNVVLIALLALLCVGGVELAACRHFAPEAYDRVTAPVRSAADAAADAGKAALSAAGQFCLDTAAKAADLAGQGARAISRWASSLKEQAALAWEELLSTPEPTASHQTAPPVSRPPATDPPLTQVMEQNGRQVLTGGAVPVVYFCQSDEQWANQLYGSDPIGPYGCGPTAMAMAVASLTDTDADPAKMARWAADHGYWAPGSGSYHSIVQGIARSFGLEAEAIPQRTVEELYDHLSSGHILVALMGKGHFTTGGHFILLRGMTLSGKVLVADPNSLERSLELWDPQLILDELSSARDNAAPLWVLSSPSS